MWFKTNTLQLNKSTYLRYIELIVVMFINVSLHALCKSGNMRIVIIGNHNCYAHTLIANRNILNSSFYFKYTSIHGV